MKHPVLTAQTATVWNQTLICITQVLLIQKFSFLYTHHCLMFNEQTVFN